MRPTRLSSLSALVIAALAGCVDGASGFVAQNAHRVYEIGPDRFEVVARPRTNGVQYFCAAGDYAVRRLGAGAGETVLLVEPDGPSRTRPGARGASFALIATAEAPPRTGANVSMREAGENLLVGHARLLCDRDDDDDRFLHLFF